VLGEITILRHGSISQWHSERHYGMASQASELWPVDWGIMNMSVRLQLSCVGIGCHQLLAGFESF